MIYVVVVILLVSVISAHYFKHCCCLLDMFFIVANILFCSTMNNSTIAHNPGGCSINNLYPAIVQCFAVIFAGYCAGWTKIITLKTGKSIGIFVWNFCLPAMVMQGMWELHWEEVNYKFLLCVLVSKLIIFLLVILVTFITYHPINFGYAGIFGIFTTCSNDFALGYPIRKYPVYFDNYLHQLFLA